MAKVNQYILNAAQNFLDISNDVSLSRAEKDYILDEIDTLMVLLDMNLTKSESKEQYKAVLLHAMKDI